MSYLSISTLLADCSGRIFCRPCWRQQSTTILHSVLKPGPARRVDPGPGRPGPGTGPGGGKNPLGNWPGETRSTRDPVHPAGRPGTRSTRWDPAVYFIYVYKLNNVVFGFSRKPNPFSLQSSQQPYQLQISCRSV